MKYFKLQKTFHRRDLIAFDLDNHNELKTLMCCIHLCSRIPLQEQLNPLILLYGNFNRVGALQKLFLHDQGLIIAIPASIKYIKVLKNATQMPVIIIVELQLIRVNCILI